MQLLNYVVRKEQEITSSVISRGMLIFFHGRSNQRAFCRKGPQSRKMWALVTHFPSPYKTFSETTQRRWTGITWDTGKGQSGKGSWWAILVMGSASPPKSFKTEGKYITGNKAHTHDRKPAGEQGTEHSNPCRKGCFNPLPQYAISEWRQQLKFLTESISLLGFYFVVFLSCWHPQNIWADISNQRVPLSSTQN